MADIIKFPNTTEQLRRVLSNNVTMAVDEKLSDFSLMVNIQRHPGESDESLRRRIKAVTMDGDEIHKPIMECGSKKDIPKRPFLKSKFQRYVKAKGVIFDLQK